MDKMRTLTSKVEEKESMMAYLSASTIKKETAKVDVISSTLCE